MQSMSVVRPELWRRAPAANFHEQYADHKQNRADINGAVRMMNLCAENY